LGKGGLNENTNGLIRQYCTRGSGFDKITDQQVRKVKGILNRKLRKTLGYSTPTKDFFGKKVGVENCASRLSLALKFFLA